MLMRQHFSRLSSLVFFIFLSQSAIAETTQISPKEAKLFANAKQFAEAGKLEQAISSYQSLIRLNPLLPEAYNNLAAIYLQQKKTKQAKNILEQGIYAHKGYAVLYEGLTTINVAMAREAYSKALQIDLKSSTISIAEMDLNKVQLKEKNKSIVISKVEKTDINKSIQEPVKAKKEQAKTENITQQEKLAALAKIKKIVRPADPIPVAKENNTEEITTVLQAWSAAWSAQATDMYLSFYHKHYKPSNGLSKKGWVQSRRLRLKKPSWIKVNLSNFKVEKNTGTQAIVNFKQAYQSDKFKDVSKKQMVLLNTGDGWRIFRERSL